MLKWLVAIILVLAMLSVAGCCCCSSSGYSGYYSTVSQDEATSVTTCDTPNECPAGGCTSACPK